MFFIGTDFCMLSVISMLNFIFHFNNLKWLKSPCPNFSLVFCVYQIVIEDCESNDCQKMADKISHLLYDFR